MPINLRVDGDALGGNHFTPARFLVPVDVKDPAERISVMGERCRWIRDEPAVNLTDALAAVLNQLPTALTTSFFGAMLKGADFVTSNIPGAPVPVYLAGAQLDRMYAFAPLSGTAVNVTLISHCGTCCIGVNSDSVAVPDPEILVRAPRGRVRRDPRPRSLSRRTGRAEVSENRKAGGDPVRARRRTLGVMEELDQAAVPGTPVGRRVFLGLLGLGALGVVFGAKVQDALERTVGPLHLEGRHRALARSCRSVGSGSTRSPASSRTGARPTTSSRCTASSTRRSS